MSASGMYPAATSWPSLSRKACTKRAAQRFSKTRMPADEPFADRVAGVVVVRLVEQSGRHALEDGHVEATRVDLLHRDGLHGTVVTAGDEPQVEDADQSPVDEVDQQGQRLARHLAAGELHDQVADRTHQLVVGHAGDLPVSIGPGGRS